MPTHDSIGLVLASRSPRRIELLRQVGLPAVSLPQELDERAHIGESPRTMVLRLAEEKGRAALADPRLPQRAHVVLAADTCVVLDDRVLGKPADAEDAAAMLRALDGRTHAVLTGVFLSRVDGARSVSDVRTSHVRFRRLGESVIRAYVATGEPLDKAGAYGLQGRGALLCQVVRGSWSNVVGLPLEPLPGWLRRLGIELETLLRCET